MAERYRWARPRIEGAILCLADYTGYTSEVYYPDVANYRQVTVVWVIRQRPGSRYEIREEKRTARLAATPDVRYTSRGKTASVKSASKEAIQMSPARPAAKAKAPAKSKAKAAVVEEPEEELELEEEELEDDEEPEDEELEDELEEDEEQDDEDEDEEDEAEEVEDEAEEDGEEEVKDYTPYASKAITPTMSDFYDWLNAEVGDLSEMDAERIVSLAGTLRMEFQKSEFCHERRDERKNEVAAAKAAKARKPKVAAEEPAPAKTKATAKPAAIKAAKPTAAKATSAKTAAKPAARTVPGKPAGRAADRPAVKGAPRRGKSTAKAEEPF